MVHLRLEFIDYGEHYKLKAAHDYKTDIVLEILSLQRAEGGMELNKQVSRNLRIDYKQLMKITSDIRLGEKS